MSDKYINPSGLAHYDEKIKEVIDGKDKELSFDEYNALSDDDKNNGTTYYVPDATLGSNDVIFSVDDETLSATYDNKTIELVDGSKIQNNLTTTEEGYALDARQGNVLDTRISALETPTFTQASSRTNIASGNTMPTILGKIMKYFTDLKSHAFNSLANNLTTTTTGYALDATQGKALNDKFGKVLWTNTNPVAFDTMTITLSSSDYDVLDIYCLWNTTSNNMYVTSCLKGYCSSIKGYSIVGTGTDNPVAAVLIRETAMNSNTSFTVNSILATNSNYNNNYLIPYKVVGRKLS